MVTDHVRIKLFHIMREPYRGDTMMLVPEDRKCLVDEYPPFSVAMCVYGGDNPDWFDAALHSVIDQTVKPNEIVLVVDGPIPDRIQSVIDKYTSVCNAGSTVFRVIKLKENSGHGIARRNALEKCGFDLVALMDADDLCVPNRFEKQLAVFKKYPDLSIVGGNIQEFIDTPDKCLGRRIVPETDTEIKAYMKRRCPMNQMTVILRKEAVQKAGGYLDWFCDEDYYLWIRMTLVGCHFANVPENLVNVRVGKEMYQRRGGVKYFKSEAKLQKYMLDNKIISTSRYLINVTERLILQVLMPNKLRGFVFQKLARSK